jgi:hypothetical protein
VDIGHDYTKSSPLEYFAVIGVVSNGRDLAYWDYAVRCEPLERVSF